MSEQDVIIRDLQKSLEEMTAERDKWFRIAQTIAHSATTKPYTYYGRTVDYALRHAEQNA